MFCSISIAFGLNMSKTFVMCCVRMFDVFDVACLRKSRAFNRRSARHITTTRTSSGRLRDGGSLLTIPPKRRCRLVV